MKRCVACGFELPDEAAFCTECGAKQPVPAPAAAVAEPATASVRCVVCGTEMPEIASFCPECGARRPKPEEAPVPPAPEPAEPVPTPEPTTIISTPEQTGPVFSPEPTEPIPTPEPPAPTPSPEPVVAATPQPSPEPVVSATPQPSPKPKRPVPRGLIIGVVVLAVIAAIAIPLVRSQMRARAYEQAMALFNAEQYQEAADAFEELGDYEDSAAIRQTALLGVTAQSREARAGTDPAAWGFAAEAYEQLGTSQGQQHAQECRDNATYYTGTQLMTNESWAEARETLAGLEGSGFSDIPDLLAECDAHLAYNDALALMSDGNWAEAREALASLEDTGFFDDITYRIAECDAHMNYEAAEALYNEGSYYDAYVAFNALAGIVYEGISDAADRAQACIQAYPENNAVYSNPDYPSTAVPLTIQGNSRYTFIKFYTDDVLVRTVFIHPDSSVTLYLPAGTYRMNECQGDLWFGENDMFGDDGSYYQCLVGGEETFDLEYGYSYTISSGNGGTGIGTQSVDRDSF